MRFTLALAFIVTAGVAVAADPIVSGCNLIDNSPGQLEGKLVSIRGRVLFGMHGTVLVPEGCDDNLPGVAVLTPGSYKSPKVEFRLDTDAIAQLAPFTRGPKVACGTLKGQLFKKRRFHLRQEGAGPQGNGYGNRGVLAWALVLHSVTEIADCR